MSSTDDIRSKIRSKVTPYPRKAHYPTSWNGSRTFEEIRDELTPSINRLMRYYRYVEVDIPDMIAHGFMRLWEELSENPDLLTTMDQGGAIKRVLYRSGAAHYRKFYRREMYLEDLAARSGDPDEFMIEGYEGGRYVGHSRFSEAVDTRIDIEKAMHTMAEKYMHSLPHLAALYYITTDVKPDDAAELAGRGGTKKCWWLTSIVKPMREELSEILGLSRPGKTTWQDKVKAGNTEPLEQLITTHEAEGNDRMVATLRNLSEFEGYKVLMQRLELPRTTINYLRSKGHKELNQAYNCRA